jgi:hypothetical protein
MLDKSFIDKVKFHQPFDFSKITEKVKAYRNFRLSLPKTKIPMHVLPAKIRNHTEISIQHSI